MAAMASGERRSRGARLRFHRCRRIVDGRGEADMLHGAGGRFLRAISRCGTSGLSAPDRARAARAPRAASCRRGCSISPATVHAPRRYACRSTRSSAARPARACRATPSSHGRCARAPAEARCAMTTMPLSVSTPVTRTGRARRSGMPGEILVRDRDDVLLIVNDHKLRETFQAMKCTLALGHAQRRGHRLMGRPALVLAEHARPCLRRSAQAAPSPDTSPGSTPPTSRNLPIYPSPNLSIL